MTRRCECHGEPMRWHKDARKAVGGYWSCRVKANAASAKHDRTRRAAQARWMRNRYDSDPVYRIGKLVRNAKNQRRRQGAARRSEHAPNPKLITFLKGARTSG